MPKGGASLAAHSRSADSAFWGPKTKKLYKFVKMCPRPACGLEPQHCFCVCPECFAILRARKRCPRRGCNQGADRSPEVESPVQESPPRPRLPSESSSPPLSPPTVRKPWAMPAWFLRCPCWDCPPHHFRPQTCNGLVYTTPAYRSHLAAGVTPSNPLWGLTPAKRKEKLLLLRQEAERKVALEQQEAQEQLQTLAREQQLQHLQQKQQQHEQL